MATIPTITIVFDDQRVLSALKAITKAFAETNELMPWRPELKRAARAARFLLKHVHVVDTSVLDLIRTIEKL